MKMYLPPPGGKPSRRGVLKKGLWGGALLTLGGFGALFFRKSVEVPLPPGGLQVLSAREYAVLVVLAQRLLPKRAGAPTVDELGVAATCDSVLAQADATSQKEFKQLLGLFENALANFLLGARPGTFTRMAEDAQEAVLEDWRTSRLSVRRTGFLALRTLVMASYFGNPKAWGAANYPGPPAGVHQPDAPVWRGGDVPRPASSTPLEASQRDAGVAMDAGTSPDVGAGAEPHP